MNNEVCEIELSIYNVRRWWSFLSAFKSVSLAVKYDDGKYVVFENSVLRKVKESKVLKHISYTEKRYVNCRSWYVGKIWLDSNIIRATRFESAAHFGEEYAKVIGED